MAAPLKYNPLLKRCLQETADTAAIQAEIDALQSAVNTLQGNIDTLQTNLNVLKGNKITKCKTIADLAVLESGEIFEWQGASGTVDKTAFVNGYFYKKTFLPATVQVLILYHNYAYINGEYLADTYYYSHSEDPGLTQYESTRNIDNKSVVWIGNSTPNVGDFVTISSGESSQSFVTITNKEIVDLQFQYTDSNGDVWSLNSSVYSRAITYNYYTNSQGVTINVNWDDFFDNMGFVCSDNGKLYLVRWTNYGSTGAKFDTVVNPEGSASYSATDTQPQPAAATTTAAGLMSAADKTKLDGIAQNANNYSLPTADANVLGGVKVGANLAINAGGVLSGNYQNATTSAAGLMSAADKSKLEAYIYTRISLSPNSGESMESGFKRFVTQLTTLYPNLASNTIFHLQLNFYNEILVDGGASGLPSDPIDGHFSYCNFIALRLVGSTQKIYVFGWQTSTWYYREI